MIILMGVPGVGKSSVINGLLAKRPDYKVVNYGDLMIGIFKEKYGIADRDQMRKASISQQKAVQKAVALKLSKMSGKVILDTHCSIQTPSGYFPGLPFALLGKLKVDKLVFLTASIEEIYNRRKNDPTRTRSADREEIAEHDGMNRAYLASYSAFIGAPAVILFNHDNQIEQAVAKFTALLE